MTGRLNHRIFAWRMVLALALFAAASLTARAQATNTYDPSQISQRFPDRTVTVDKQEVTQEMRRTRLLNSARQKAIVSDADKLLALARQLNAGVTAEGVPLNAAQRMKIAADIEKLAHSVKERMTYAGTNETVQASPFRSWQ